MELANDKKIIVIDPGHGGHTGASCAGIFEDDIVYGIARRAVHYLMAHGYRPVLTRSESYVSLDKRTKTALQANAHAFISIHCNASNNPNAGGVEAFYVEQSKFAQKSYQYAKKVMAIMELNGWKNRGIKPDYKSQHSRLKVLRDTCNHMLAVLFEFGFITNPNERKLLVLPTTQDKIAMRMVGEIKGLI